MPVLLVSLVALLLFALLLGGDLRSWRAARKLGHQLTLNQCAAAAEELALRFNLVVEHHSKNLALLANLWREAPTRSRPDTFLKYANGLVNHEQTFDLILFLDSSNIMMVTSPARRDSPLSGLDIQSRPANEDLFKTIRKSIAPLGAPPTARLTSRDGLVIWFPVLVEQADGPSVNGTVAGSLHLTDMLAQALAPSNTEGFWIQLEINDRLIHDTRAGDPAAALVPPELVGKKQLSLMGMDCQVTVWPKGGGPYSKLAGTDYVRLLLQVILSVLVSGFLWLSLYSLLRMQRSRRRLKQSEKRYQTLVDSAIDGILVFDRQGRILDANRIVCRVLDATREDLAGRYLGDIAGPDMLPDLETHLERLNKTGALSLEMTYQTPAGRVVPLEISARGFDYYQTPAVISMLRDISRRKAAVNALAESEQRFRAIFEQAGVGIMQSSPQHDIQQVNDKMSEIIGYSRDELIGMSAWLLLFPEDHAEIRERIVTMQGDVSRSWLWEKRLRHKSGQPIWVRWTISLVHSANGKHLYTIDVIEDNTERRKLERQLRQAQKLESIGTLAGGIAHDFNNILGTILGYTQMAMVDSRPGGKTHQRLEQVFKAANLAKKLVRQILTFSRRGEKDPQAVTISPIIKETLKFLRASLPSNIEVRQNLSPEQGMVMADPIQIHQIVMNLCTNAVQAMTPGGGCPFRGAGRCGAGSGSGV